MTPLESEAPNSTGAATAGQQGWVEGTWTTGYWDCCKPSCAWPGRGRVDRPITACDVTTGAPITDGNVKSVCDGGRAASCSNNHPFLANEKLALGFAAAAVSGHHGLTGNENCGQCFELHFVDNEHNSRRFGDPAEVMGSWGGAHPRLVGKAMVVQVSNIGYDVSGAHSFDIQIPGAGQGLFSSGCAAQFAGFAPGDFDCNNRYGGCHVKDGCSRLPAALQLGCHWRYDWLHWLKDGGKTNNPWVKFRRVRCPHALTAISGSTPSDDALFPAVDA